MTASSSLGNPLDSSATTPKAGAPTSAAAAPGTAEAGFLRNLWYFALPGRDLKRSAMKAKTLLGEPLLFGRTETGEVFAIHDICPHRGIPLSYGNFDGREVECCYHGWRFGPDGRCMKIPSLVESQTFDVSRIRVRRYPCREVEGAVWVYMREPTKGASRSAEDDADLPPPPILPGVAVRDLHIVDSLRFPCHIDHAVVGLMDPAHGPFVHRAWWWRSGSSIHEKAKRFGPSELGFTMLRHRPSKNSRAYVLLGGAPETEIAFRLPGVRIEHIQAGRHTLVNLTAVTPIDATTTEINHLIYWTLPWLTPLQPVLRRFARAFLEQDRRVVEMQQEGLKHQPGLMLIDDADRQAKWYYRLKREWQTSQAEGRPFVNPVTERTLRWKS